MSTDGLVEDEIREGLDRWFGHADFRPGQYASIEAVVGGHALARVTEVLLGVKTRYITENGLDQLSTYGLLSGFDPEELGLLLGTLVRAGCAALLDDGEDLIEIIREHQ